MDFKVIFRDTFIDDLGRIVRAIAIHNREAAQHLGESIIARAEKLNFFSSEILDCVNNQK